MRVSLLLVILIAIVALVGSQTALAQEQEPATGSYAGEILCPPQSRHYRPPSGECLMDGPAAYIDRLIKAGIRFPIVPFRYSVLDPEYFFLDYQYMWVRDDIGKNRIPVYGSMSDVGKAGGIINYLETNQTYITYWGVYEGKYVQTTAGTWLARGDVSPVAVPQTYRGLLFPHTPPTDFGWVLLEMPVRSAAGHGAPEIPGMMLYTNEIVQIYESLEIDGAEWNRISMMEEHWVEGRLINRVMVNTTPPEGVENGRWIEVNLAEQTVSVYDNRRLVFAAIAATGIENLPTRPGLFQVYEKHETTPMSGSFEADRSDFYYLENVPWTLYFDEARALHGAYWRAKLGIAQSHGCVNLSVADARWIFEWAEEGDWVYVWDPTGKTPTDPSFYGEGGA